MKLKELQQKSKFTIKENAERLNIPLSTYNNYLIGYRAPNLKTLTKLADYFNVSLDYLCDHPYNNQIGYIPDEAKPIIKKLISLDETKLLRVDAYITALIDELKK